MEYLYNYKSAIPYLFVSQVFLPSYDVLEILNNFVQSEVGIQLNYSKLSMKLF